MVAAAVVIAVLAVIGIATILINITTLAIIYRRKRLQKPSNYPIISFLIAGIIQGAVVVPSYCLKRLELQNAPSWICDIFRFPYFLCGHMLTLSILLVAVDRVVAISRPFRYDGIVSKTSMMITIVTMWLVFIVIDALPFVNGAKKNKECKYVPWRDWSIAVLILTIVIPMISIFVSYAWIWRLAARHAVQISKTGRTERRNSHFTRFKSIMELRATKTSLILVGIFLLCWAPIGIYYLVENLCNDCVTGAISEDMQESFKFWVKVISYTSSIFSPLAYCWRTREFRHEVAASIRNSDFKAAAISINFVNRLHKVSKDSNGIAPDLPPSTGPNNSSEHRKTPDTDCEQF